MNLDPTLDSTQAGERVWDAVVVGAGPAGSMAARELARGGARTLLLDKQTFPRSKVCGGCLNGRTLALLASSGLDGLVARLGAEPIGRFELWTGARRAAVALPRGASLSRTALDAALIEEALDAGSSWLPATRAALGEVEDGFRTVRLPDGGDRIAARVIVAADGLASSLVAGRDRPRTSPSSLIGAAAEVERGPELYRPGTIYMAVARGGYVGVVRVEGGRLNLAAALDPALVRREGGLAGAVAGLLSDAGLPAVPAAAEKWRGTPPLTRRAASRALERVFLLGDAAGYVEPFTGEGISWALESAIASAPLVRAAIDEWTPELARAWEREHRRRVGRRQRWCRAVAWWLRHPTLVDLGVRSLNAAPPLARPLVAHLNAAPAGERS